MTSSGSWMKTGPNSSVSTRKRGGKSHQGKENLDCHNMSATCFQYPISFSVKHLFCYSERVAYNQTPTRQMEAPPSWWKNNLGRSNSRAPLSSRKHMCPFISSDTVVIRCVTDLLFKSQAEIIIITEVYLPPKSKRGAHWLKWSSVTVH